MPSLQCFGQLFPVILRLNCGLLIPVKIIVSICFHKVVGRAAIQRLAEALFKTGGDDIYLRGAIPPPDDFFSFSVFHFHNYLISNILSFIYLREMNKIFEVRFLLEEGAYRVYVTDERRNMDQKDIHFYLLYLTATYERHARFTFWMVAPS
mgnify:CR=1 FL=1